MTREEAKGFLIDISYKLGTVDVEYLTVKDGEKMREAIKALEKEPDTGALNKVRAEIVDYQKEAVYSDDVVMTKRMILSIIDKHKAEQ